MNRSLYASILRVSSLTVACVLTFQSGIVTPVTRQLSDTTYLYLAQSSRVVAQVEKNELNTLSEELRREKEDLERREAELRTIESRTFGTGSESSYTTYILSVILFILTVLILLNYILDWRRLRREPGV